MSRYISLISAALTYAASGLPVFPCVPRGKEPAISRGFYAATTNPQTIRRLWRQSDCNIGIPTGSVSGVWVLDIDGDDGEANLHALEARHGALPATREVISGGGRHLWFAYNTGEIPSTAGRIGSGIDVRCDGGYVIAPPSIHPSGRAYRWVDEAAQLADAPAWLIERARRKPRPSISERALAARRPPCRSSPGCYGAAALRNEIATLAGMPPGGRNHALNRVAFALFQLVAGGELDRGEVVEHLIDACHRNGLVHDDGLPSVVATIRSGEGAGMRHPRSRGAEAIAGKLNITKS